MPRPITPIALRRKGPGHPLQVQATGGQWIEIHMIGESARKAVYERIVKGRTIPGADQSFEWRVDSDDDMDESPVPQDAPQDAPVQPQDTPQDTPQPVSVPAQPAQPAPSAQPATDLVGSMAEFVRGIAREEDNKLLDDLADFVEATVAQHAASNPGGGGITRVNAVLPQRTIEQDGLFHKCFPDMLHLASIGQHLFLPGPPGTGKTHVFEQVADALGYERSNISCYNQMPESRIWGARDVHGNHHETDMLKGLRHAAENPESGFMFLFDEMDSGSPNLYTSMNTAMSNGFIKAPNGDRIPIGSNVVFVAAANTFGTGPTAQFAGKNAIDPATLDRFEYVPWEIDEDLETALVRQFLDDTVADSWLDIWRTTRRNVADHGLKIFVTPRGAIKGAKIIASGMEMSKAYRFVFANKIPADQLAKVSAL